MPVLDETIRVSWGVAAMGSIQWTTLSEVQSKPVQWLWEGRVPFGKVTLMDGEPGSGKSLLALDVAARVSRGVAMPLEKKAFGPANVVIFNADDSVADTVRPRLEAAGADLTRIRCFDGEICAADLADVRPALIVLDPLAVYLCLEGDTRPRQVIKNLAVIARDSGAAVLAVQYMPKSGFWASEIYEAARTVLHVSTMGHGRHRVAVSKSNLRNATDAPPLVYHLDETDDAVRLGGWADSV